MHEISHPYSSNSVANGTKSSIAPISFQRRNLLSVSGNIGHCVSSDLAMFRGLAKSLCWYNTILKEMASSFQNSASPGSIIAVYDNVNCRWIYNLVTKQQYFHKPTLEILKSCLEKMCDHAKSKNVKQLYLPKIATGLDRLNLEQVLNLIKQTFNESNIKITICCI